MTTIRVLALVGRLEPRDWVDVITVHDKLQPLGYLVWAACAKDSGFSPAAILAEAARSGRYTQAELSELAFDGAAPEAAALATRWHAMLADAGAIVDLLPPQHVGEAVLTEGLALYTGEIAQLACDIRDGYVCYHAGRIGGVLPQVVGV